MEVYMESSEILRLFNEKLAGELLSYNQALPYLDDAIDEVNTALNTIYPAFSELPTGKTNYDYFSNRYIRNVVIPCAAWHYFVVDEEGINTAVQFKEDYQKGLYYMLRDTLYNIPVEYQAPDGAGSTTLKSDTDYGERGIVVPLQLM
jgi:hypothetical protein